MGASIQPVIPYAGILQIVVTLSIAIIASCLTARISVARWPGRRVKVSIIGCAATLLATFASILFHGLGMRNIQTIFLACVFLYASYGDMKTHEMDDFVHVIVLAVALIAKPAGQIPASILAAATVVAVMLVVAAAAPGTGIGGADMKFCAAGSFLMSTFVDGLFALGFGTFVALLFNSPFRKKKDGAGEGFPMLPYLSCSYMIVFLLSNS